MGWLAGYEGGIVSEREMACPACGSCWYTDGFTEYGCWEPVSEDACYCPECGAEGEV